MLRDVVFERGSLANVRALKSDWRRVRVNESRATGLELGESHLVDVVFEGARLDYASFRNARLERVVFRDCRLEEADFGGAKLETVTFERCPLARGSFAAVKVKDVTLTGCELDGLAGAEGLRGTAMPISDLLSNVAVLAAAAGIRILDD